MWPMSARATKPPGLDSTTRRGRRLESASPESSSETRPRRRDRHENRGAVRAGSAVTLPGTFVKIQVPRDHGPRFPHGPSRRRVFQTNDHGWSLVGLDRLPSTPAVATRNSAGAGHAAQARTTARTRHLHPSSAPFVRTFRPHLLPHLPSPPSRPQASRALRRGLAKLVAICGQAAAGAPFG